MTIEQRRTLILGTVYSSLAIIVAAFGFWHAKEYFVGSIPSDRVQLVLSKDSYRVGETVQFQVINNTDDVLYVGNDCPSEPLTVERLNQGGWQRVSDKTDPEECVDDERAVGIPAYSSRSSDYLDWQELFTVPGQYRLTVNFEHYRGSLSQTFTILPTL
jgi:hypothetical protein